MEEELLPNLNPTIPSPEGNTQLKAEDQALLDSMDFGPIKDLLQEKTPRLIPGEVGRFRLMEALRLQFGEQFRGNSAAREAINQFDR